MKPLLRRLSQLLLAGSLLVSLPAATPATPTESRFPDVSALIKAGRLRFLRRNGPAPTDSAAIVALFGRGFRRSTSRRHGHLTSGGDIDNNYTHLIYQRQGVEFVLANKPAILGYILLTKPYRHAVLADVHLGTTTLRTLHEQFRASRPTGSAYHDLRQISGRTTLKTEHCTLAFQADARVSQREIELARTDRLLDSLVYELPVTQVRLSALR